MLLSLGFVNIGLLLSVLGIICRNRMVLYGAFFYMAAGKYDLFSLEASY